MSVLTGPLKCPCRLNTRLKIAYEFLHWHVKTQYCIKHVIVGANCVDRRSEIFTTEKVSILCQYCWISSERSEIHSLIHRKAQSPKNAPPHFSPWESDMNRRQPCQVQSSLIPCMLRHLNRAEAAGPPVCESTGFPEGRQWHPVFRPSARQWSFCIPKEPWTPRTWLPVSLACPSAAVARQRSGILCLKCELSLPPLSPFDDSLGADSLTLRVRRVVGVGSWGRV